MSHPENFFLSDVKSQSDSDSENEGDFSEDSEEALTGPWPSLKISKAQLRRIRAPWVSSNYLANR